LLYLLGTACVVAAAASDEDLALDNGAGLYAVYCSACHGNAPVLQSAAEDAADYAEFDAIAQSNVAVENVANPEDEEWPEWADRPNPNLQKEPDEREEIMNLVTAAIEEAHEIKPPSDTFDNTDANPDQRGESGFTPMPGATDLSKPQDFHYGTSEEEVFDSIANGTGAAMPGWRTELGSDEDIWDVVHYIRSFWSADWL